MKFKIGDRVRCIDSGYPAAQLIEGNIYTISNLSSSYATLKEVPGEWIINRFELVQSSLNLNIKKVIFNPIKKTTVILWKDNTKTIVKTHNEKYDKRAGFLIAYFQKNCGLSKSKANKYIDSLCEDKIEILEF